ncbi:MAG: type II toxin-antitoxin system RelE/ParE family toxin [Caulobacterales bacterium]
MARYRLTQSAQDSLEEITEQSLERWGRLKTAEYMAALHRRFQWLAENPKLGRIRDDIGADIRSYLQGSHMIFYRVTDYGAEIVGVPHASMDLGHYFG